MNSVKELPDEANRETVAPTAAARERTVRTEAHVVRTALVVFVESTRPVAAVQADIVHARVVAVASGREEDSASRGESLRRRYATHHRGIRAVRKDDKALVRAAVKFFPRTQA